MGVGDAIDVADAAAAAPAFAAGGIASEPSAQKWMAELRPSVDAACNALPVASQPVEASANVDRHNNKNQVKI